MQAISGFIHQVGLQFANFALSDLADIAILAVALYYLYRFVRERRAGKVAIGLALLILLYVVTAVFELDALNFLLRNFFQVGLLALVILFQPELRSALEKVGAEPLRSFRNLTESRELAEATHAIDEICIAAGEMSRDRTGALIVIERAIKLGDIQKTGVAIDAVVSQNLIRNLFFNKAALHDGAIIISDYRIAAAGCFLPLTQSDAISMEKGTRHRAGVGVSEVSDALVIIVSEETGEISLAENGKMIGGQNYATLKQELSRKLIGEQSGKRKPFSRKNNKKADGKEDANGDEAK